MSSTMACLENVSSIIASIESLLGDPEVDSVGMLRVGLRNIKTLLLCLRKLGYNADLGSLLLRIQDCITRIPDPLYDLKKMREEVHYLGKELDDLYRSWSGPSICLTVGEVVNIAGCILENIVNFLESASYHAFETVLEVEVMDALKVQVAFCRDVLFFTTRTGVDQGVRENLLIHAETFAIMAARVFINHKAPMPTQVPPPFINSSAVRTFMYSSAVRNNPLILDDDRRSWHVEILSAVSRMNPRAFNPLLYQAYTQALSSSRKLFGFQNLDDNTLKNFLNSLLSLFWDMLRLDACHLVWDKYQMQVLYDGLRFCRSLLKQQPRLFDKDIWDQIGVFICDAGVFICSLHQGTVKMDNELSDLLESFHAIQAAGVKCKPSQPSVSSVMKTNPSNISHGDEKKNTIDQTETGIRSHERLRQSTTTMRDGVVGLDDEIKSIVDRIVCGSRSLRVVAICGMAGIGKTTLASQVYNHPEVNHRFHVRGWCTVSQVLDKKKLFVELLNQTGGSGNNNLAEDDLANLLRRNLLRRRYLIVLDDVWTTEAWESLKMSFPDDPTQSRIILTSRQYGAPPHGLLDQEPYSLRLLQDNESLEIMRTRLFPGKGWPSELMDLGMRIAEKCKGLPLTVVVVTGLLATTEQKGWKGILDALTTGGVSSEEQCNIALELSYKHLPRGLKHCLLYFAAFKEDEEVSVKKLILLWIAENFVENIESKRMEDVARDYLQDLIQRSLVTATESRSIGGVKTCQIHDLQHDFCLRKAKEESFLHLVQGHDQLSDFAEPCNLQRLCIHSEVDHFKESKLFCPSAHSLLFFSTFSFVLYPFQMSFIIEIFKLLKVLEIGQIWLATSLPSEIELLTLLRYLSFSSIVGVLPSSAGNLYNLETLISRFSLSRISLPHSFWNLPRLKYLSMDPACELPYEEVENSEMETLGRVVYYFDGSMEKRMKNFPNVCNLKCMFPEGIKRFRKVVVALEFLSRLESLTLSGDSRLYVECVLPECLRKVTLSGYTMPRREISVLGKLPKLEVLKLRYIDFVEDTVEIEDEGEFMDTLEMKEEEFPALRHLELSQLEIRSWTASDEPLPRLQKLILDRCWDLKEIPDWLETIPTLEEVTARDCTADLESLVQRVKEVQGEYGNTVDIRVIK